MSTIYTVAAVLGVLAGGGGVAGLYKAWRASVIRNYKVDQVVEAVVGTDDKPGLIDTVDKHGRMLARVVAELRPNGGSSLRDAINRIEKTLEADTDTD